MTNESDWKTRATNRYLAANGNHIIYDIIDLCIDKIYKLYNEINTRTGRRKKIFVRLHSNEYSINKNLKLRAQQI